MDYFDFVISQYNKLCFPIKLMLKIFYGTIIFLYFTALIIIALYEDMLPDFNTAYFWMTELIVAANKVFVVGIVPLAIYGIVTT